MICARILSFVLAATTVCAPITTAWAQTVTAVPKVEAPPPVQAAERYLKEGRRYNRAIALLTEAAAKSPSAPIYRLLGMAYAARYASVGFARHQSENYEWQREEWNKRRLRREKAEATRDPDAEDIIVPRAPDPPVTPDDSKAFALSPEQSRAEMIGLGNQCLAAFNQARKQAELDPDEQTATESARGWSILLLQRMGRGIVTLKTASSQKSGADKTKGGKAPESLEIGEWDAAPCFALCVQNAPKNAEFWQSLALARAPRRLMPNLFGDDLYNALSASQKNKPIVDTAPGTLKDTPDAAWQVACTLRPSDWELWWQRALYRMADDPAGAVEAMQETVNGNPTNTTLWYGLAALRRLASEGKEDKRDKKAEIEALLLAVEAGNAAPAYAQLPFRLPLPAPLRKAWALEPVYGYGSDGILLQLVGMPLLDQLKIDIAGGQEASALRIAIACLGLSAKTRSSVVPDDLNVQSEVQRQAHGRGLIGGLFGQQAYVWIRREQAARPSDTKSAFLDRYSAIFEQLQNWEKNIIGGE